MEFSKNIAKSGGGAVRTSRTRSEGLEPSSFRSIWVLWRRRYTLITAIIAMLLLAFVYLDLDADTLHGHNHYSARYATLALLAQ